MDKRREEYYHLCVNRTTEYLKKEYTSSVETQFEESVNINKELIRAFKIEPYSYRCLALSEKLYTCIKRFIKEFRKLIKKWSTFFPIDGIEEKISKKMADDVISKIAIVYTNLAHTVGMMSITEDMDCVLRSKILTGIDIFNELGEHMLCLDRHATEVMKN